MKVREVVKKLDKMAGGLFGRKVAIGNFTIRLNPALLLLPDIRQ